MKAGWTQRPFEACLSPAPTVNKVQRKDFLPDGRFPVVSQESGLINGYWDGDADVVRVGRPLVIFGDHTKAVKYVDFDFVVGADGVKVLATEDSVLPRWFFYWLQSVELRELGYARHYRLLRELQVPVPPLPEQRRIVGILDEAFEGIAAARANEGRNLENAVEVSKSFRAQAFETRDSTWREVTLDRLAENLDSKRVPITKSARVPGPYPYYGASGVVDYVSDYLFDEETLLVSEDGANLLSRTTPIAFPATGKYWVNNHAHVLLFNSATTQRYVEAFIESISIAKYVTGAAQPKLTQKALYTIPIAIPTSEIRQAEIVAKLEEFGAESEKLRRLYEQKLAALDELKKSLLHHAFTGQL